MSFINNRLETESLKAARRKYLQLGDEIEQVKDSLLRANLEHTHSKLGIFLSEAIGYKIWKQFDNELEAVDND